MDDRKDFDRSKELVNKAVLRREMRNVRIGPRGLDVFYLTLKAL